MVQEEVDNSKLEKLLIQKKINLKGWKLEVEGMSGTWGWHNPKFPDCVIYATHLLKKQKKSVKKPK